MAYWCRNEVSASERLGRNIKFRLVGYYEREMNEKGLVKCNTDVVRTRRFELVDVENHMRAYAHVLNGNAEIALSMRGGNRRVKIAAAERGGCEIQLASDAQASQSELRWIKEESR